MAESFRDLIAWQKAMALVTEVYRATSVFPDHERYGLTNQIRRAAVGIASNIAEGKGRLSKKEFVQFSGDCPRISLRAADSARNRSKISGTSRRKVSWVSTSMPPKSGVFSTA